ncbi:hypothetical protein OBK22_09730 [Empedobacter falsenii]|uniref:hypothetical protein n=1 Tax=Empedobacter stercoris TaxID=1628248 RepID=UPI001CE0B46B|nr:hypothetical protein [Empedobacter stercoris]MCA4781350.1 hypothetical protein [Empedobacter stercoris]
MKNLIATLLLCSISTVNAQEVNDYKYIHIPEKFSGFEQDQYQLNNRLRYLLTQKKYEVLPSDKSTWPQEVTQTPCSVLNTDILKVKSFLNNKLEVVFTDCSQNNIETFEGTSKIKEFDKGYQEALKLALMKLKTQNAKTSIPMTKLEQSKKEVNKVATPEPKSADVTISNLLTDGSKNYQKIDLQNGGFILMSENGNQVIAKFETTSKTGVYRVVVTNGNSNYSSVGYSNENSIAYEVLENNVWKEVKLTAK